MKLDANLVARGWADLQSLDIDSEEYRAGSWAFEIVLDAMIHDGPYLWEIIEQILIVDCSGKLTEALAVGILDDFLSKYALEMFSRIEARAVESANFRKALQSINLTSLDRQLRIRIQGLNN